MEGTFHFFSSVYFIFFIVASSVPNLWHIITKENQSNTTLTPFLSLKFSDQWSFFFFFLSSNALSKHPLLDTFLIFAAFLRLTACSSSIFPLDCHSLYHCHYFIYSWCLSLFKMLLCCSFQHHFTRYTKFISITISPECSHYFDSQLVVSTCWLNKQVCNIIYVVSNVIVNSIISLTKKDSQARWRCIYVFLLFLKKNRQDSFSFLTTFFQSPSIVHYFLWQHYIVCN